MDVNNLNDIIKNLIYQDYILISLIIFSWLLLSFLKTNITFKLYYWALTGFIVFLVFNLWLNNLNDNDIELLNWFRDSLINIKIVILYISYYSILFLPILFLSDNSVNFKQPINKIIDIFSAFIMWILYPVFLISLLLTIINNKMLFWVDMNFLISLEKSNLITWIISFFSHWIIFSYLNEFSYIISFLFLIILFYKLTLSWLIIWIIKYFLSNIFNNNKKVKVNDSYEEKI